MCVKSFRLCVGLVVTLALPCFVEAETPRTKSRVRELETRLSEMQARVAELEQHVNAIVDLNTQQLVPALRERNEKTHALSDDAAKSRKQCEREIADLRRELHSSIADLRAEVSSIRRDFGLSKAGGDSAATERPINAEVLPPSRAASMNVFLRSTAIRLPSFGPNAVPTVRELPVQVSDGEYRIEGGDRFRLSRDGNALRIVFSGGPNLIWANGRAIADATGMFRGTMTGAFSNDPRLAPRSATISIRAVNESELWLDTESIVWTANGRETKRTRVATMLVRYQ